MVISEYRRNIEKADGYFPKSDKPAAYQGTPDKLYLRYIIKSKRDFSVGITAKKDPGETFSNHHAQKGLTTIRHMPI